MKARINKTGVRKKSASPANNADVSAQDPAEELRLVFDTINDEGEDDLTPSNFGEAVTWATDWTTETIILQLQRGVIDLDPNFQRRDAWRAARKSRFIESLILGLPIPQIVLAEKKDKKGNFLVIDGKQRLLTLQQFCRTPEQGGAEGFKMTGLFVERELNDRSYGDLLNTTELREKVDAFHSQTIRTVVIKNWPNEDFLYTVFLRLNSNSVPLSPQELRKALHPGPFMDFVEASASNSGPLLHALDLNQPDFRMRDVEIVIRHYAFKNFARNYKGNLKTFLDDTCMALNKAWMTQEGQIRSQFSSLESAITTTESIFGPGKAFRKFAGGEYEARLNRAVFDVCLYYFSMPEYRNVQGKEVKIRQAFQDLCSNDREFLRALETSTKTTDVVKKRFDAWGRVLSKVLGLQFKSPFAA